MKVFKFNLASVDVQTVSMPADAELLHVAVQRGDIALWALCDDEAVYVDRNFVMFGTGHDIQEGLEYEFVGTVLLCGGDLVLHIFEMPK